MIYVCVYICVRNIHKEREGERTSMHRLISSGEKKKTKCGCVRVAFRRKKTESRIDEQEEVAASD